MTGRLIELAPQDRRAFQGVLLVGVDDESKQPVLRSGTIDFTLEQLQRQAWDQDEPDRFSPSEVEEIYEHLRKHLT